MGSQSPLFRRGGSKVFFQSDIDVWDPGSDSDGRSSGDMAQLKGSAYRSSGSECRTAFRSSSPEEDEDLKVRLDTPSLVKPIPLMGHHSRMNR